MTLMALAGASCLAGAIASGDLCPLDEAQTLRAESARRLESANLARERAASRVHDLEALHAGRHVPAGRLEDLRSVVLDVASTGTGFGVRWTHPLLELPRFSEAPARLAEVTSRPAWHVIDPVHRGPVAAFGLTLIFASVLSGGGDRKIHASSPDLDDTLPQNCRSYGESQMSATAVLAPSSPSQSQDFDWMPNPVDALEPSLPVATIDDEEEGDLFYFDDEDDDQDEDEDDGFFFDDDEEDDEKEDDEDAMESGGDGASDDDDDDDDDEEESGFGNGDDEEYEFDD